MSLNKLLQDNLKSLKHWATYVKRLIFTSISVCFFTQFSHGGISGDIKVNSLELSL